MLFACVRPRYTNGGAGSISTIFSKPNLFSASQTFSKSLTQYPKGVSPFFIEKGKGSKVWDVDGNEYIDFVNSLAAVTLGYCDKDVDNAVQQQMKNGIIFSLPHTLNNCSDFLYILIDTLCHNLLHRTEKLILTSVYSHPNNQPHPTMVY
jgi:4-aminobutyrate aminotransferase-like enzyme